MQAVLGDDDYHALHAFRFSIRRFLHFSELAARAEGIEPRQHQLLLAVRAAGPGGLRIGDIAERLCLRPHSAAGLADRAERQGLARRSASGGDRREVYLELTPEGERALEELSLHHMRELQTAGPALARTLEAILEGGDIARAEAALARATEVTP
jgi:DNA-binding MarR family transcriptional regulator